MKTKQIKKYFFEITTVFLISLILILFFYTFIGKIKVELLIPILTIITAVFGYFSHQKRLLLENSIRIKTEAYDKYIESLSNYIHRDENEIYKKYQASRFKLCLYANDETVRAFLDVIPKQVSKYNTEDGVSKVLYAIRKEINPKTNVKNYEMAGIDPAQWKMELTSFPKK